MSDHKDDAWWVFYRYGYSYGHDLNFIRGKLPGGIRGTMHADPVEKIRELRERIDRELGPATEAARFANEALDEGLADAEAGLPPR